MAFPDSTKKAPNIFVSVTDDTGSLVSSVSTISKSPIVVNVPPGPPPRQYFTTVLYPYSYIDDLRVNEARPTAGILWSVPIDDMILYQPLIISGSLNESIVHRTYNDGVIEQLNISMPMLTAGTLISGINHIIYNDGAIEQINITGPMLTSGTLVVTISYINYTDGAIEDITVSQPSIVSGELV